MRNRRIIFTGAILLFLISGIKAQESRDSSMLTIQECRILALEHNQKIKIAQHQVNIAENSRKSAMTHFFPSLDFTGQYMRTNKKLYLLDEDLFFPVVPFWAIDENTMSLKPDILENPLINGIMIDPETGQPLTNSNGDPVFLQYGYAPSDQLEFGNKNLFILNAGLTQPIYMGGKIRSQYRIAKITQQIQTQRKALTEDKVVQSVEEAYWRIISLNEKKKLADAYKLMLDTLVRDLKNIEAEGIITGNDVLQAQMKQNEVALQQYQAENGLKLAHMALNQLIGFPLDSLPELDPEIQPVQIFTDRDAMIQKALANRPELEVLNQSVELAQEGIKLAWSRFLPMIAGTANYSYYNPNPYNGFTEEFGGDWNVGITCRIPITQWGDRIHGLNSAKELKEIAILKEEETREMISLQVQKSWNGYLETFHEVDLCKLSLKQAEENLRIKRDHHKEGMATTSDLLEAHAMWQEAATKLLEAQTKLRNQEIEIKKSTGQL